MQEIFIGYIRINDYSNLAGNPGFNELLHRTLTTRILESFQEIN